MLTAWSLGSTLGLTWGFRRDWPDFVHDVHGLPLSWATHTLSTFAGPADFWNVDLFLLAIDLVIWQVALAVALLVVLKFK